MKYDDKYWENRFFLDVPERVKAAIKKIYESYPKECMPQGLSDPMYIMNVICKELGVGDGRSNFYLPPKKCSCIYAHDEKCTENQ